MNQNPQNSDSETPAEPVYDPALNDLADQLFSELDEADSASGEPADEVGVLLKKLQAADQEVLRVRAELENYRKRVQRDVDQQLKFANVPLIRDLLEVVDNLNRAAEAASGEEANSKVLLEGVQMVTQQFTGVLTKFGCKQIEAVGQEFDPNYHEAIAQLPSTEYASGIVSQEVAVGYKLHDRVIRPAQVIVSK